MPITELLERNAREFPKDIALVEINPDIQEKRRVTWRDYELIQPDARHHYRRDITWHVFNEKANRVANLLISRGIRKGDKVAILMMNCLEWLPIYFGILKTGALAVPMNFRFDAQEIKYCLELSETDVLIFRPEFVGRIEEIVDEIDEKRIYAPNVVVVKNGEAISMESGIVKELTDPYMEIDEGIKCKIKEQFNCMFDKLNTDTNTCSIDEKTC